MNTISNGSRLQVRHGDLFGSVGGNQQEGEINGAVIATTEDRAMLGVVHRWKGETWSAALDNIGGKLSAHVDGDVLTVAQEGKKGGVSEIALPVGPVTPVEEWLTPDLKGIQIVHRPEGTTVTVTP